MSHTFHNRRVVGIENDAVRLTVTVAGKSAIDPWRSALGVAVGETTADGRCTLGTVECLGSCGTAPVMMVNETYFENVSIAKLDALIDGWTK